MPSMYVLNYQIIFSYSQPFKPPKISQMSATRTLEDLIDDIGGLGKFQIVMVLMVNANILFVGWSILIMSYIGKK